MGRRGVEAAFSPRRAFGTGNRSCTPLCRRSRHDPSTEGLRPTPPRQGEEERRHFARPCARFEGTPPRREIVSDPLRLRPSSHYDGNASWIPPSFHDPPPLPRPLIPHPPIPHPPPRPPLNLVTLPPLSRLERDRRTQPDAEGKPAVLPALRLWLRVRVHPGRQGRVPLCRAAASAQQLWPRRQPSLHLPASRAPLRTVQHVSSPQVRGGFAGTARAGARGKSPVP